MGNVLSAGLGQGPARQVSLRAGIPDSVPSTTDQQALRLGPEGRQPGRAGDPGGRRTGRGGGRHGEHEPRPAPAPAAHRHAHGRRGGRGLDAPRRAVVCDLRRTTWGSPPRTSPARTASPARTRTPSRCAASSAPPQAVSDGVFDAEIVPVSVPQRRGDPVVVARDEFPRPDTTARGARAPAPGLRPRRHGDGRQLVRHQRRGRGHGRHERRRPRASWAPRCWPRSAATPRSASRPR